MPQLLAGSSTSETQLRIQVCLVICIAVSAWEGICEVTWHGSLTGRAAKHCGLAQQHHAAVVWSMVVEEIM